MKTLKKLYYKMFPRYRRLELKFLEWTDADILLSKNRDKSESEQWHIAKEEDENFFNPAVSPHVYLERKERITE